MTDFNYSPPVTSTGNQDASDLARLVSQLELMKAQLSAAGLDSTPPKVLSAEEQVRAALDNNGVGLGTEERLQELYRHLNTIAKKVGI